MYNTDITGEESYVPLAIKQRLEYLRGEIIEQRISYLELVELQDLADYIQEDDVELLQWAGVEEFPDNEEEESIGYD